MNDQREFLEWFANEERKRIVPRPPLPPIERPTIHYTELPKATAEHRGAMEWNYYLSQVGRHGDQSPDQVGGRPFSPVPVRKFRRLLLSML